MKTLAFIAIAAVLVAAPSADAQPGGGGCGLGTVKWMGELQSVLARRAVEVINLAADPASTTDGRLQRLIAPSARFSLGAGDVDRPLGAGVAGARALAREMKADSFRFLGWDYIPSPVNDACGPQKVEVEFVDSRQKRVYPLTFTFKAGRLEDAAGWSRSFESGPVSPSRD